MRENITSKRQRMTEGECILVRVGWEVLSQEAYLR